MIIEVRPAPRGQWVATSDSKLRASGATPGDAIVALKRASLVALAKGDIEYVIEWDVVPRRDVAARDKRVLGTVVKWKKHELGRPFTGLSAATFGWLVDERFVLPGQPMNVGATAAKVRAFMEARPGVTASGQVVGNGRPDCRVEVDKLFDAKGKPIQIGRGPVKSRVSGTNIARQTQGVELSADIDVEESAPGGAWSWRSKGGAVSGTSSSLERARDDAARASFRALATRLSDDDVARAAAMRIAFDVTTKSPWVVDHLAPDVMHGGYAFRAPFAALRRALGAPLFDPFDGEPLYGWGLRARNGNTAWVGVRLRDSELEVTEGDAAAYAKTVGEFELAATDDRAAESVTAWLHTQCAVKVKAKAKAKAKKKK